MNNLTDLLLLVHEKGPISQRELMTRLNLSFVPLSNAVRDLSARGEIVKDGYAQSTRGRRPALFRINPKMGHFIGIDIGLARVRLVITDFGDTVLFSSTQRSDQYGTDMGAELKRQIEHMLKLGPRIDGIGVSESGRIDCEGVVTIPRLPGWLGIPLQKVLQQQFGLPVLVMDSARAAAVAEQRLGQVRGTGNVFYVALGMGIGSAIFIDGRLYQGQNGLAGEFGHITLDEEGPLCYCGNRGCLEVYSGGKALIESVRSGLQQGVDTRLRQCGPGGLSYEAIVAAATQRDRLAYRVLSHAGLHLGNALVTIVNLLNPKKIVLGGILPQLAGEFLLEPLMRSLRERTFPGSLRTLEVVISSLGDDAPARGAASEAAREWLKLRNS